MAVDHNEQKTLSELHEGETRYKKFFDWVMLRPGVGHVEMTVAKAIFKLMWTPLLRHVAVLMGFRSPKAMSFIQGYGDNHITCQIIQVVTGGLIRELVLPYVRRCADSDDAPTVDGFITWTAGVKNNNYYMMLKSTNLLVAFCLMRRGVRKNI